MEVYSVTMVFYVVVCLFLLFRVACNVFGEEGRGGGCGGTFSGCCRRVGTVSLSPGTLPRRRVTSELGCSAEGQPEPGRLHVVARLLARVGDIRRSRVGRLGCRAVRAMFRVAHFLRHRLRFNSGESGVRTLGLVRSVGKCTSRTMLMHFLCRHRLRLEGSTQCACV